MCVKVFKKRRKVCNQIFSHRCFLKDGAYCAYVLRISRYSDFLLVMLTNTGIFLRGLKLSEKKYILVSTLGIQKENWG